MTKLDRLQHTTKLAGMTCHLINKAVVKQNCVDRWINMLNKIKIVRVVHKKDSKIKLQVTVSKTNKLLYYWQRKAASLLPSTEWGWKYRSIQDVSCTLQLPWSCSPLPPHILSLPPGGSGPPPKYMATWAHMRPRPQTALRSVQPLLQGSGCDQQSHT